MSTASTSFKRQQINQMIDGLIAQRPADIVELMLALQTFLSSPVDQKHVAVGKLVEIVNREFKLTSYRLAVCQMSVGAASQPAATNNMHGPQEEDDGAQDAPPEPAIVYLTDIGEAYTDKQTQAEVFELLLTSATETVETPIQHENMSVLPVPQKRKRAKRGSFTRTTHGRYQCEYCEETFRRADYVKRHMRVKHTGEKPFVCGFCSKQFFEKTQLNRHVRQHHTKEKPHKCHLCGKAFAEGCNLQKHLESSIHVSKTPGKDQCRYQCKYCEETFRRADYMKRHIRVKHTGEKPFVCKVCSKQFSEKTQLNRHVRLHHTKIRPHKCHLCGKAYAEGWNLRKHLASSIHVSKTFTCNYCNEVFTSEESLDTHERGHQGERPFKCQLCDKAFKIKAAFRRHMQQVHQGVSDKNSQKLDTQIDQEVSHVTQDHQYGNKNSEKSPVKQEKVNKDDKTASRDIDANDIPLVKGIDITNKEEES